MIVVLDASAAAEIAFNRSESKEFESHLADAVHVLAPHLFVAEVANAAWKHHRFGELSRAEAEAALEKMLSLPDELADDQDLAAEAFALACRLRKPSHDMFYLALARRHNARVLTMDKALRDAAGRYLSEPV
jgi:predicted nucleic acid-binding protein